MTCVHLKKLFELVDENQLEFSSSDLVRIVCKQCEKEEVCPSVRVGDYVAVHPDSDSNDPGPSENDDKEEQ